MAHIVAEGFYCPECGYPNPTPLGPIKTRPSAFREGALLSIVIIVCQRCGSITEIGGAYNALGGAL